MSKKIPNPRALGTRSAQDLLKKYDFNKTGDITESDLQLAQALLEIELREEKAAGQKKMAWVAIISMIVFSAVLFSPMIPDSRVSSLSDLLGLFYLAQAGVVGAYMGFTTWMSKHG